MYICSEVSTAGVSAGAPPWRLRSAANLGSIGHLSLDWACRLAAAVAHGSLRNGSNKLWKEKNKIQALFLGYLVIVKALAIIRAAQASCWQHHAGGRNLPVQLPVTFTVLRVSKASGGPAGPRARWSIPGSHHGRQAPGAGAPASAARGRSSESRLWVSARPGHCPCQAPTGAGADDLANDSAGTWNWSELANLLVNYYRVPNASPVHFRLGVRWTWTVGPGLGLVGQGHPGQAAVTITDTAAAAFTNFKFYAIHGKSSGSTSTGPAGRK